MNELLIRKAVEQIRTDPEHWYQGTFQGRYMACGTTRCFAGWMIAIHYATDDIFKVRTVECDGVEAIAQRISGLTYGQCDTLFYAFEGADYLTVEDYIELVEGQTGLDLSPERNAETEGE